MYAPEILQFKYIDLNWIRMSLYACIYIYF